MKSREQTHIEVCIQDSLSLGHSKKQAKKTINTDDTKKNKGGDK